MSNNYLSTWFNSHLSTSPNSEAARLKTDEQPASFEQNTQFKIFYRIQNVSHTNQLVMKFESVNSLNIMIRKINLWEGGREYLVYGDDGSHTVTGSFSSVPVYNVNGRVLGGGSHPVSDVTASLAIGSGIFTAGNPPTNGDGVLSDTQGSKGNNQPISDNLYSGVGAGLTFYLVFNHIGANNPSSGQFYLQWEELF